MVAHRQSPNLSRLSYGRRVNRANRPPPIRTVPHRSAVLEQCLAQRKKPRAGLRKALLQRYRRRFRKSLAAGADGDLAQGVAAAEMQQEHTREVLRRLVLPQSLQGTGFRRQRLPAERKEAQEQLPVLIRALPHPKVADAEP